jgi:hypothetical protein
MLDLLLDFALDGAEKILLCEEIPGHMSGAQVLE